MSKPTKMWMIFNGNHPIRRTCYHSKQGAWGHYFYDVLLRKSYCLQDVKDKESLGFKAKKVKVTITEGW